MSIKLNFHKTALLKKSKKGFQGFPVATIAFYGPNDRAASKVVVGIEETENSEPSVVRWHSPASDIRRNADVLEEIVKLLRRPPQYAIGSREEAIIYADAHRGSWQESQGAMEWLKSESTATSAAAD